MTFGSALFLITCTTSLLLNYIITVITEKQKQILSNTSKNKETEKKMVINRKWSQSFLHKNVNLRASVKHLIRG